MDQSFEALPPDDELREILERSLQPPKSREEEERPRVYKLYTKAFGFRVPGSVYGFWGVL